MKKVLLSAVLLLSATGWLLAQSATAEQYAATIRREHLQAKLEVLASNDMMGRETATEGQRKAAEYLQEHFVSLGLEGPVADKNGYQQSFALRLTQWDKVRVKVNGDWIEHFEDFFYNGATGYQKPTKMNVVFVGAGTEEALAAVDVQGNIAFAAVSDNSYRETAARLREAGAAGVMLLYGKSDEEFDQSAARFERFIMREQLQMVSDEEEPEGLGSFYVAPRMAKKLFGKSHEELMTLAEAGGDAMKELPSPRITVQARQGVKDTESSNVLGFLPGTDLQEQVIVITAHYDHLGMTDEGQVYNGADDDGSGTSAVMELAEAFAQAAEEGHRPRRSILFMLVSGEEKGLLGSEYYTDHPVFPLENTVANLNIDMIGRQDDIHEEDPYYVYVIGSDKLSTDLHTINEEMNEQHTQLDLDYRYNDENDPNRYYYRSDHYNFAKNNIPVVFYFNGTHEDYHKTTDTVEKIHFGKVERITRLVFYTAWELANREERIVVDKVEP